MMKNKKVYEFVGKVSNKFQSKVYNKKSLWYGNIYYRLWLELEKNEFKEILAFKESLKKEIWIDIQKSYYSDKKYIFYAEPKISNYQVISYKLIDWKEIM